MPEQAFDTIRAVVFPEGSGWVAHCLEIDLATSARLSTSSPVALSSNSAPRQPRIADGASSLSRTSGPPRIGTGGCMPRRVPGEPSACHAAVGPPAVQLGWARRRRPRSRFGRSRLLNRVSQPPQRRPAQDRRPATPSRRSGESPAACRPQKHILIRSPTQRIRHIRLHDLRPVPRREPDLQQVITPRPVHLRDELPCCSLESHAPQDIGPFTEPRPCSSRSLLTEAEVGPK